MGSSGNNSHRATTINHPATLDGNSEALFRKKFAKDVIILGTFTGEAMKSANDTLAYL